MESFCLLYTADSFINYSLTSKGKAKKKKIYNINNNSINSNNKYKYDIKYILNEDLEWFPANISKHSYLCASWN